MLSRSDPLVRAWPLLRPRLPRLLLASACGVLSLGSALALAGVSAWLITRAWQMPPVLDLTIAVVAVRAFGISRGVLHYCERLAAHDTALRSAATAREQVYRRLAQGPVETVTRLHTGQLVSRISTDVDELADVLVRAVLPIIVAIVLAAAATAVIAVISPAAAVVLGACLLLAGVAVPWLAAGAATAEEDTAARLRADRDTAAMAALDHAPELRIAGRLSRLIAESEQRHRDWGLALDRAAAPAALAAAVPTAAMGISVLGAAIVGIAIAPDVTPMTIAVLMLLPLSAFEATTALPGAAIHLTRARLAAGRLLAMAETPAVPTPPPAGQVSPDAELRADRLRAGLPGAPATSAVTIELRAGDRLAVVGPSGSGKTTLLMTLAGLVPARRGDMTLGGVPIRTIDETELRRAVCFFAEDAHLFATTVRDNLLVARGDCGDDELKAVLDRVGLGRWLAGLPDGLATVLIGGAVAVSAGQRRRLLLARAMLSPARVVLLDEPTEHLDLADADTVLQNLLSPDSGLFGADRTVVVATHHLPDGADYPRCRLGHYSENDGYPGCRSSLPG